MNPTLLAGPEIPTAQPLAFPAARPRLLRLHSAAHSVVSCYLRLGVEDRTREAYRVALREAMRNAHEALDALAPDHPTREQVLRDLARVEGYALREGPKLHAPGLAVFACEAEGAFIAVALPRVFRTVVQLGDRPRLAEAVGAADAFGRIITLLVDRTGARFFEVTAFDARELPKLHLQSTRGGKFHSDRADSPGWGERDFHQRIREERHRGAARMVERLAATVAAGPCQGIVLAGGERTVAEVQRFLPRSLASLLLGTAHLPSPRIPSRISAGEVRVATLEVRARWERAHEHVVLDELEGALGTGWAVNGVRPTLRALFNGQLRTLVVPAGQFGAGFRCADTGRLALARIDCRGHGEPQPVPDLVSEVLEEALAQRVEVEVVDDEEEKERVDGLAGMLRFA